MFDEQVFSTTLVPGGTVAAPVVFPLTMAPRVVVGFELVIPLGCRGYVGVALGFGGTRLYPGNAHAYYSGDGQVISRVVHDAPSSGAWQLLAYNLGQFPHTIEVRFQTERLPLPGAGVSRLFTADALSNVTA